MIDIGYPLAGIAYGVSLICLGIYALLAHKKIDILRLELQIIAESKNYTEKSLIRNISKLRKKAK